VCVMDDRVHTSNVSLHNFKHEMKFVVFSSSFISFGLMFVFRFFLFTTFMVRGMVFVKGYLCVGFCWVDICKGVFFWCVVVVQ